MNKIANFQFIWNFLLETPYKILPFRRESDFIVDSIVLLIIPKEFFIYHVSFSNGINSNSQHILCSSSTTPHNID